MASMSRVRAVLPYEQTKKEMKAILTDIQTGKFVRDFMQENAVGQPFSKAPVA